MRQTFPRLLKRSLPILVLILVSIVAFTAIIERPLHPSLAASSTKTSSVCQSWNVVTELDPAVPYQVAALSPRNIWVVGSSSNGSGSQTFTKHWNGTTWSIVPSPNADLYNGFSSVVALSSRNVWAIGYSENSSFVSHTLIEHWNGTKWSIVPSPSPGTDHNFLYKITASEANNLWALGAYGNSSQDDQPLLQYWNGIAWSIFSLPTVDPSTTWNGLAATSPKDLWLVGTGGAAGQALIEHWNGTAWSVALSAVAGTTTSSLTDITLVPGTINLWAVGSYIPVNNGGNNTTFIFGEHWNGKQWNTKLSSTQVSYNDSLSAVTTTSGKNVWAIGSTEVRSGTHVPITAQWNGVQWLVSSPSVNDGVAGVPDFNTITHVPGTNQLLALINVTDPTTLTQYAFLMSCG